MNFLELSFWSVIPPLLTIFLVLKTRKILLSMAVGITLGCFILGKFNPINALKHFDSIFIGTYNEDGTLTPGSITTPDNLMVLLSMVIIGALIGLLVKSGRLSCICGIHGKTHQQQEARGPDDVPPGHPADDR